MTDVSTMAKDAVAVLALSAITLTALAVVTGYKQSGALGEGLTGNATNASADKFIAGLAIFGTFMAIIVLALVGKIIVKIFKPGN